MIETRKKINYLKTDVLDNIKKFADKGNLQDLQKFTEFLPKIQLLLNNLDDIDLKVNLLERNIHDVINPPKNGVTKITALYEFQDHDLNSRDIAKIKRNEFISKLAEKGVEVVQYKGVTYRIKKTSKLMGVAFSGEKSDSWFLGLPELDLKTIVLLCMKDDNDVYTFILPESFCDDYLKNLSRSNGQLKFSLRKKHDEFLLYTKIGNVPVKKYLDNYSAFE